jgi:hypothetical protein
MGGCELSSGDDPFELVTADQDPLEIGILERSDELRNGRFWREFDVFLGNYFRDIHGLCVLQSSWSGFATGELLLATRKITVLHHKYPPIVPTTITPIAIIFLRRAASETSIVLGEWYFAGTNILL